MPIENAGRPFEVRVEWRGDAVSLEFLGELDLWGRDEAAAALAQAAAAAPHIIVVNLQGLSFMGSTGLRCLLEAKLLADAAGVRMAIVNGSGPAHRLLELTRLGEVIEMVDDPAQLDPQVVGR
jgi:anti-sigma B factor antagonist